MPHDGGNYLQIIYLLGIGLQNTEKQPNNKNKFKKWTKELNRHCSKEDKNGQ